MLISKDVYAPIFKDLSGKAVWFLQMYGNVGDELINCATRQLFDYYGVVYIPFRPLEATPPKGATVVHSGGGNIGSYVECEAERKRLVAAGCRMIILPSTCLRREVDYTQVYIRDHKSLEAYPEATFFPDMALSLDTCVTAKPRIETGVFLRSDKEALFGGDDPAKFCQSPFEYLSVAALHGHIYTDRLHFAIAGLLVGTKVTLLPNSYFKNRAVWEASLIKLGCEWADEPPAGN